MSHDSANPHREYTTFLAALLEGDLKDCTRITDRIVSSGVSLQKIYESYFSPALYQVGDLWACNMLSVAREHTATSIVESLMNRLYLQQSFKGSSGGKALIVTLEGELHQVGAKMVADIFELNGWETAFPGSDRNMAEVLDLIEQEQPDVLGISFSVYFHLETLFEMLSGVRSVNKGLPILLGGQGLKWLKAEEVEPYGVTLVPDLESLVEFTHSWRSARAH